MRRAVFLDRDGVLNVDTHYLHRISDVIWVPGAKEAVSLLTRLDYQIFIVTNQSGIARGYYTESDVQILHQWMCQQISEAGGRITAVYYCPFLEGAPLEKYNKKSDWRHAAGIDGYLFQGGRLDDFVREIIEMRTRHEGL